MSLGYKYKRMKDERGGIMILCALSLLPLLIIVAFVVDGTLFVTSSLQQQTNAEQVAFAALRSLDDSNNNPILSATAEGETIGGLNTYISTRGAVQIKPGSLKSQRAGKVEFGVWDPQAQHFEPRICVSRPCPSEINAVRAELYTQRGKNSLIPFFMKILKARNVDIRSEAIVYQDEGFYRVALSHSIPYGGQ